MRRTPLSRERVLRAAITLADRGGIEALTMRRLGQELGVEAMSLYKHVSNKDDVLDGIVDLVLGDIDVPPPVRRGARRCEHGPSRRTRCCWRTRGPPCRSCRGSTSGWA